MASLELRQLQYFVAVAEHLHFGRAAEALSIGQPAVSQQIARLERILGTELLDRTPRTVRLTEQGSRFLPEARKVLVAVDRARASVTRSDNGAGVLRIGTCSGKPYFPGPANARKSWDGELIPEHCGDEMSVGMTKFYRVTCFQEIGGFVRQVMWDGIDCHRCRMLGWLACSWDEPELRFIHLRPMGSSQVSIVTGRRRHGFGQYFMGTSLPYMTVSAVYRATKSPYLIGGAAMWWGFVESMVKGKARFDDPEFRRFLRHYQWECLLLGKAKDPWGSERLGLEAEFTINRKEFGLNWNAVLETGGFLVGDDVRVTLSIQAIAD